MATNIRSAFASYKVSTAGGMNMVDLQTGVSIIDTRIRGFGYAGSTANTIIRLADVSGTIIEQPITVVNQSDTIYFDALGIRVNGKVSMTMVSVAVDGTEVIVSTSDPKSRTYIYYG
jgi:hypothetical protein|tara:strand:+ start:415 stop:765 length:351 start_codon:yes stop_codon:yes gene_type:complete